MVWLELSAETMVVSVPAVEQERYYSVRLIDGNTYNCGYIGSRALVWISKGNCHLAPGIGSNW